MWSAPATSTPLTFSPDYGPTVPYGLYSPNYQTDGEFGGAVAINGTFVVIGAEQETVSGDADAGHAYVYSTTTGLVSTLSSPNPQANGEFGFSVSVFGTTVVVGAPGETASGAVGAGHVYLFNALTGALITELTSPHAQAGGSFGLSVAAGSKSIVVGAPGENVSGILNAGRAYSFDPTTYALLAALKSPSPQNPGGFGISVAVNGKTAVIGAEAETASGVLEAGHAYAFNAKTGHLEFTLTSPNPTTDGFFGVSVGVSSSKILVGAPYESASGDADAGHAYSFSATTGALSATLVSAHPQADGVFGYEVGISGTTGVVGAYFETSGGKVDAGNAYTVDAKTGKVIATLTSPDPQTEGFFGDAVAINGATVVVGAAEEAVAGVSEAGRAYLFGVLPLGLTSPSTESGEVFGTSVAVSGTTVVVGAPGQVGFGGLFSGVVYAYNTVNGAVTVFQSPNPVDDGHFGQSVGISGSTIVVGAPGENGSGVYASGRAYVFNAISGELVSTLVSPNAQEYGDFGYAVAVSGNKVVVAATEETVDDQTLAGRAYVFEAKTGSLIATLTSPNSQSSGLFGYSVAIDASTVVVGAAEETASGYELAGHAYTFNASSGELELTLSSPNAQLDGFFGLSVAIDGSAVVVGAPWETVSGVAYAGHVYTFDPTSGDLLLTLVSPNNYFDGFFGNSVAISGTQIAVGAPYEYVSPYTLSGHAYTFHAATGQLILETASPNAQTQGYFGLNVAINGDTVVVGAPEESASGLTEAGHAYLFWSA